MFPQAAGRSSSTTISIPTSTTRPWSSSRSATSASATLPCGAGSNGWSECSPAAAAGARSTSTTRRSGSTGCRSATSARSPTSRRPTSPRTLWRPSGTRRATATRSPLGWAGCSQSRSRTAPGSAAGGLTTSTAPVRPCRRALAWLDSVQQPSGGFGEDIASYSETASRGRGAATPSQTAWALLAYISGGAVESLSTRRAAEYLLRIQRPDGDWDEQHYTGTGFPLDFMIRYHLYRLTFPLLALGRLRERLTA